MLQNRLYNGYYIERDIIFEDEPEEKSFHFLENICAEHTVSAIFAHDYLHGFCDVFSYVLNQNYDIPIHMLWKGEELIHSYGVLPLVDGYNAYIDIRGATTDFSLFIEEFQDFITYDEGHFYDAVGEEDTRIDIMTKEELETYYEMYHDTDYRILFVAECFLTDNPDYYDPDILKEYFKPLNQEILPRMDTKSLSVQLSAAHDKKNLQISHRTDNHHQGKNKYISKEDFLL